MPTIIAIESKTVTELGAPSPYEHLYLVKRTTDDAGNVVDERVIRGTFNNGGELVAVANIALALSDDARGSETLAQRHHRVLDLGGRDPDAVWNLMVQHAKNINAADLEYSVDLFDVFPGIDLNSNTIVASALHTVGINVATTLPVGISTSEVPLYDQVPYMLVDDVLIGSSLSDKILGGVGNDRIDGGAGDDELFGEAGFDVLFGRAGNDILNGGFDADRMNGGLGNDTYYLDFGDRVIEKNISADGGTDLVVSTLSLSLGSSDLIGVENVTLQGSADLVVRGNVFANVLVGNSGDNRLVGRAGDDTITGGRGDDDLLGNGGNDLLRGGGGDDLLIGGAGSDRLVGGAGSDAFLFGATSHSLPDVGASDVITDFSRADFIDLWDIDANVGRSGDQAFSFIGAASFTRAGQLRYEVDQNGDTIVQGNVDADLAAEFQVTLQGYSRPMVRGDFIL